MFWNRNLGRFGIDLGVNALQLLQLSRRRGALGVETWATVPFPDGLSRDAVLAEPQCFAPVLRAAIDRIRPAERRCWMAVPASLAISRMLSIPRGLSIREIPGQVLVEAHRVLPLGIDELSMDYQILDGDDPHRLPVRLVATRRMLVSQMTALVEGAGLRAEGLVVEDDSVIPVLGLMPTPPVPTSASQAIVVLDILEEVIHLCRISRNPQRANLRLHPRAPGAGTESFFAELRSILERSLGEQSDRAYSVIWILARDEKARICAQRLEAHMGLPVITGHPLGGLPYFSSHALSADQPPIEAASLVVCGLAMHGLA